MGILSALVIAALLGLGRYFVYPIFYPPEPKVEERDAVIALVNDLRRTPLFFRMYYFKEHSFIDEEWRKVDSADPFFESMFLYTNLPQFAFYLGEQGQVGHLMMPKVGVAQGIITDVDTFTIYGEEYGSIILQQQVKPPLSDPNYGTIDANKILFFVRENTLLPAPILQHADDHWLPADLREQLQRFIVAPDVMSFKKASLPGEDILLMTRNHELYVGQDGPPVLPKDHPERPKPGTALYRFEGFETAYEFINAATELHAAIGAWGDQYNIDLDLLAVPVARKVTPAGKLILVGEWPPKRRPPDDRGPADRAGNRWSAGREQRCRRWRFSLRSARSSSRSALVNPSERSPALSSACFTPSSVCHS